jgi:hypothetical protein
VIVPVAGSEQTLRDLVREFCTNGQPTLQALESPVVAQVNGVNRPCDLAVDREGIFHIVGGGGVEIWTRAGRKLGAWGEKGLEPGQFKFGPRGCWIDGEDSLYIGEVGGNGGLQKFRRV